MTRVSDALARAAQNPAPDVPVAETGPEFPVETPADMWTTEGAGVGSPGPDDDPGEVPAPASTPVTTLTGSLTQEKLITGITAERGPVPR